MASFYDEARPEFEQVLEWQREHLGETDRSTLISYNQLAVLHKRQGRFDEAAPLLERAVEGARVSLTAEDPLLGTFLASLGSTYQNLDRNADAVAPLEESVRILEANGAASARTLAVVRPWLIQLYEDLGRPEDAERLREVSATSAE